MDKAKTPRAPAARKPQALDDTQLDRVAGGARPTSPRPIIIVGG